METKLMNVDQLAEYLSIGRPKAYQLVNSEGFPCIRLGRIIRIPVDSLEIWLKEQTGKGA